MTPDFLDATLAMLLHHAEATKTAETDVRREAAEKIAALEATRVRAYRRHHFVRLLGEAARGAPDHAAALAAQTIAAMERFGWSPETVTDQQQEVFDALVPIMGALADIAVPADPGAAVVSDVASDPIDLVAALDTFETWYAGRFEGSVWKLFDRFTPDLPVTDF